MRVGKRIPQSRHDDTIDYGSLKTYLTKRHLTHEMTPSVRSRVCSGCAVLCHYGGQVSKYLTALLMQPCVEVYDEWHREPAKVKLLR